MFYFIVHIWRIIMKVINYLYDKNNVRYTCESSEDFLNIIEDTMGPDFKKYIKEHFYVYEQSYNKLVKFLEEMSFDVENFLKFLDT